MTDWIKKMKEHWSETKVSLQQISETFSKVEGSDEFAAQQQDTFTLFGMKDWRIILEQMIEAGKASEVDLEFFDKMSNSDNFQEYMDDMFFPQIRRDIETNTIGNTAYSAVRNLGANISFMNDLNPLKTISNTEIQLFRALKLRFLQHFLIEFCKDLGAEEHELTTPKGAEALPEKLEKMLSEMRGAGK